MDNLQLKEKALLKYFSRSNDMQKKAIFKTRGTLLIIAGAGSGKTTVLCNRIANMLLFGDSYESRFVPELSDDDRQFLEFYTEGRYDTLPDMSSVTQHLSEILGHNRATPWKILAVTFTNKAASELKERLSRMNAPASEVWAATFHSTCVRILRRSIESIGYDKNFVIYDTDDSKRVIKNVLESMNMSEKSFNPKVLAAAISRAKDKLIPPERFPVEENGKADFMLGVTRDVYTEYQKRLKAANALDFDDIIMKTVQVLRSDPAALDYWQRRFDYIMVDEYQDTNMAQYELVKLLSGGCGNLCVVGDEDQSIYKFRGATIENILSFEKEFDSAVIKLEQNYRSTENILNAANAVIKNNTQHKDKKLWSELGEGEKIKVYRFTDEQSEALFVTNEIMAARSAGGSFADNAILYRNNSQSRNFELMLSRSGVPYKIVGGTRFYERKEIRDAIAYLSVISNPYDTVRLGRIINEPKRGIGETTWGEIQNIALGMGISPVEVMARSEEFAAISKKAKTLKPLADMFAELSDSADEMDITEILDSVMERSGYTLMLMGQGDEGAGRLENINELKSSMITFTEENESATLFDFLEQAALISDLDSYDTSEDKVTLMTMHSAKGLEFENVFLVGAEENIFPSYRSAADIMELEEDRRLCYVAITRAKRRLYITTAQSRLLYGQTQYNKMSRFIDEIPGEYMEYIDKTKPPVNEKNNKTAGTSRSSFVSPKTGKKIPQSRLTAPAAQPTSSFGVSYSVGERVRHKIYKEGTIIKAEPAGNDTLLEISFDTAGTKKLMANYAKLTKI